MYGISKSISDTFGIFTLPSFGTIKPALKRLENRGFIKTQKTMSQGGRPSVYYSITKSGNDELKRLIIEPPLENPINFLTSARIKLACADILEIDEQQKMLKSLKNKAESILINAKNITRAKDLSFYPKMVFDNVICEYQNLITLMEGFEHAGTY